LRGLFNLLAQALTAWSRQPAQGMNEELAALERALRRAAKDRAEREAALDTLRTDLEDSMAATGEAETRLEMERAARQDIARRLLAEQVRSMCLRIEVSRSRGCVGRGLKGSGPGSR
jgi:septal ring factor EnvC (AmiA/AmiB activator)